MNSMTTLPEMPSSTPQLDQSAGENVERFPEHWLELKKTTT
jgi:hypothetical protein